jgi:hypothetical protein
MKRLLLVLACASTALAANVTLTMNEVPFQAINGLAVTKGGVTFTFSDAGGGLFYNSASGGSLTYVQDPSIAGPPEPFTVVFSPPVNFIQFAMSGGPPLPPGTPLASVQFYNGTTLLSTVTLNASLTDPYSEGQLTYTPATQVTSITVTPAIAFGGIGFDNLVVTPIPPPVPTVPLSSPLTLALMTLGIVGLGGYALRRRFGPSPIY